MSAATTAPFVAMLVCDRDGTYTLGYDQTPESLRLEMSHRGWASDVATTEATRPYGDLCPNCCEEVTTTDGGPL